MTPARVTGLKGVRMQLGEPDASGRARPIPRCAVNLKDAQRPKAVRNVPAYGNEKVPRQ